ncbi:hypothetical protein CAPTEDRAFT_124334 [Capitella teleta]|uniref:C-type lectin domain-containing protein n=1 Tax=Capitella teleta TaxID=283909 RepID=R7T3R0_CAPTE|nr:hypothetical protein CAPTEDRAFT_124334 [Capitella teleta]|eukprot:ELT87373.1 hypothetical protein CAPTEDRAFT_124334 [Capitella teleta]
MSAVNRLPCIGICPDGSWTKRGSYCYLAECTQRNAEEARERCASLDATLVSVHDIGEHLFIQQLGISAKAAIGSECSTNLFHIDWVWDDGTPSDYFKWGSSEPDGLTEYCAMINTDAGGGWGDCNCGRIQGYICKRCEYIV